ncbi:RNA polymerase sigma factor [Draconibacterium sp. IB214405]|uniref:RNA polymerase sigma factor n=1 Tax=Draconibacterium sp. IB214405 TaxID=3097352 RepID=UPI002A12405E|nr:RNA polymerase sigma factor [Draconibacterium sp. IB214405]MDX8338937.1 RNA polymerase sigma factor [Draconibacterium sp. IB214405]
MNASDDHVIELVNLKRKDGYKYLYDYFFPSLCRFSYRITNCLSESEDIIQELFVKLWNSDVKFNSKSALISYLYLSAKNASLNALRNSGRKRTADGVELSLLEKVENGDPSIQQIMIEEEVHRQIYNAIYELSPERRKIILLSMQGFTNSEIAKIAGISINTVKSLKLRSYGILRTSLRPAFYTLLF